MSCEQNNVTWTLPSRFPCFSAATIQAHLNARCTLLLRVGGPRFTTKLCRGFSRGMKYRTKKVKNLNLMNDRDDKNGVYSFLSSWVNEMLGIRICTLFTLTSVFWESPSHTHTHIHTMQTDRTSGQLLDTIFEEISTEPTFMVLQSSWMCNAKGV